MRKIIHKLMRYSRDGVNVVADVNAAISTGRDGASSSSVQSYSHIVQWNGQTVTNSESEPASDNEPKRRL
jgi:hypothetical protein